MSHLESAVQRYIQLHLDSMAGPNHTAHVYTVTEEGFVILVKRVGSKAWHKESMFTLTWQESLQMLTLSNLGMSIELARRVEERKK